MEFSIKSADPPTHSPNGKTNMVWNVLNGLKRILNLCPPPQKKATNLPFKGDQRESTREGQMTTPPLPLVRSETGDGWCHNNEKNKKNNTYQNLLEGRVLKVWNCAKLNSA